jgi:sec-independent protein translocase protein TatB
VFGSIGMTELIVIFVVALLVIGPNRLPDLARTIGKAFGDFKRATSGLQDSLSLDDDDFGIEADGEEKTAETEKEQPGDEEEKNPAAGEASPPEASAAAPGDEPSPAAGEEPEGAAHGEGPDGGEADPPSAERTQAT